jgi:hypothetical protein
VVPTSTLRDLLIRMIVSKSGDHMARLRKNGHQGREEVVKVQTL